MVTFRRIEFIERFYFRDDRLVVNFGVGNFPDDFLGGLFLYGRVVENRRTVRRADVVALTIQGRRVVHREKDAQEVGVGNMFGIEFYLYDFGMSGRFRADFLIRRIFLMPARIARNDVFDAA